jgi:hypothetical protein
MENEATRREERVLVNAPKSAEQFIAEKRQQWEGARASGRPVLWTKDVGRRGRIGWVREAWTLHIQSTYPTKVISLERLRAAAIEGTQLYKWGGEVGAVEYRLGYWTLGGFRSGLGRWVWGQFSLMIPTEDLQDLLDRARADGTLLPGIARQPRKSVCLHTMIVFHAGHGRYLHPLLGAAPYTPVGPEGWFWRSARPRQG